MQLVAYGAQDIYLTGNPQITFFKAVYRRYTNFAMELIQQTINGSSTTLGSRVTSTISRSGDLVMDCYLEFESSADLLSAPVASFMDGTAVQILGIASLVVNPGTALINQIDVQIGGQTIDTQYGHSMEVWNQLTQPSCINYTGALYNQPQTADEVAVVDEATLVQRMSGSGGVVALGNVGYESNQTSSALPGNALRVPLQFWFNTNPGLALPLIALQYHEVEFVIQTNKASSNFNTVGSAGDTLQSLQLWCNYVYLDTDERRRFAQVSHEYLITQWQWQQNQFATTIQLNFNHPVSEIIWAGAPHTHCSSTPTQLVENNVAAPIVTLKLNGTQRFAPQDLNYFSQYQVNQYHSGPGSRVGFRFIGKGKIEHEGCAPSICVYSFALNPEELQPSGTCNFSRIDNAQLVSTNGKSIGSSAPDTSSTNSFLGTSTSVNIYARNYNVLRIMSGMGGLAYSN